MVETEETIAWVEAEQLVRSLSVVANGVLPPLDRRCRARTARWRNGRSAPVAVGGTAAVARAPAGRTGPPYLFGTTPAMAERLADVLEEARPGAGGAGAGASARPRSRRLAVTAARSGLRTLVSPSTAQRLSTALGIAIGNEPEPHPEEEGLWVAMLDATASWQEVVRRHTDPEVAERLIGNEFFEAATSHFPASQSFAAAEQAATYIDARAWDLVVIDTRPPPAASTSSPPRPRWPTWWAAGCCGGSPEPGSGPPVLRPDRRRCCARRPGPGVHLLERIAEFFMDLRTTYDGVAKRGRHIERHMKRATTVVVTTSDPAPMREAVRFFHALPEVASRPAAVFFNRSLPESWIDAASPRHRRRPATNLIRWEWRRRSRVGAPGARGAPPGGDRHGALAAASAHGPGFLAELIESADGLPRLW